MHIQVSGQHISIGNSIQEYVIEKLSNIVKKYFAGAQSGHVHFSKQGREFGCDIVVNEGTGRHMIMKSNCFSDEIYNSFDIALSKLEKQLRRDKSNLNNQSDRAKLSEITSEAVKYIISHDHSGEKEFNVDNPAIVAEKPAKILSLSVGEAVMKMDLENLPALLFENVKTGRINVVYYRKDGNISWVDTK